MNVCVLTGKILFSLDQNQVVTGDVQIDYSRGGHKDLSGAKLDFSGAKHKQLFFSTARLVGKHIHCVCEDTGDNLFLVLKYDIRKS